jgi:hypothetical protein
MYLRVGRLAIANLKKQSVDHACTCASLTYPA